MKFSTETLYFKLLYVLSASTGMQLWLVVVPVVQNYAANVQAVLHISVTIAKPHGTRIRRAMRLVQKDLPIYDRRHSIVILKTVSMTSIYSHRTSLWQYYTTSLWTGDCIEYYSAHFVVTAVVRMKHNSWKWMKTLKKIYFIESWNPH